MKQIAITEKAESLIWGSILTAGVTMLFLPTFLSPVLQRWDVKLIKVGVLASGSLAGLRILYRYRPGKLDREFTALKNQQKSVMSELELEKQKINQDAIARQQEFNRTLEQAQQQIDKERQEMVDKCNALIARAEEQARYWQNMYIRSNAPILPVDRAAQASLICQNIQFALHQLGIILDCNREIPQRFHCDNAPHKYQFVFTLYPRNQEQLVKFLQEKSKLEPVIENIVNDGGIDINQLGSAIQITYKPGSKKTSELEAIAQEKVRHTELKKQPT